jgi:hypothetical protein
MNAGYGVPSHQVDNRGMTTVESTVPFVSYLRRKVSGVNGVGSLWPSNVPMVTPPTITSVAVTKSTVASSPSVVPKTRSQIRFPERSYLRTKASTTG